MQPLPFGSQAKRPEPAQRTLSRPSSRRSILASIPKQDRDSWTSSTSSKRKQRASDARLRSPWSTQKLRHKRRSNFASLPRESPSSQTSSLISFKAKKQSHAKKGQCQSDGQIELEEGRGFDACAPEEEPLPRAPPATNPSSQHRASLPLATISPRLFSTSLQSIPVSPSASSPSDERESHARAASGSSKDARAYVDHLDYKNAVAPQPAATARRGSVAILRGSDAASLGRSSDSDRRRQSEGDLPDSPDMYEFLPEVNTASGGGGIFSLTESASSPALSARPQTAPFAGPHAASDDRSVHRPPKSSKRKAKNVPEDPAPPFTPLSPPPWAFARRKPSLATVGGTGNSGGAGAGSGHIGECPAQGEAGRSGAAPSSSTSSSTVGASPYIPANTAAPGQLQGLSPLMAAARAASGIAGPAQSSTSSQAQAPNDGGISSWPVHPAFDRSSSSPSS